MNRDNTPRLLAEWARQSATLLSWPNRNIWQQQYANVQTVYGQVIAALTEHQNVILCLRDKTTQLQAEDYLRQIDFDKSRLTLYLVANNDSWIRDYGPLSVSDDQNVKLINYRFNGWGNKFPHDQDDQVCQQLASQNAFGQTSLHHRDIVLEGGSIETDGNGTVLTTCACLLNPNRNPQLDRAGIESELRETLGAKRLLWLENGFIIGDDTDGHIDMLARFCDPHTIAYCSCDDPLDPHYESLKAMKAELESFRDGENKPYKLIALPIPKAITDKEGQRLPASYANFLIANKQLLLPGYNDPMDAVAKKNLEDCFPGREIVMINCLPLIHQGGSLHCASMQIASNMVAQ